MKPKTKIQFAVVELCEHLPKLSQDQIDYAENKFFPKLAYATKSSGFCLECGGSIDIKKIVRKKVVCDCCGETLKVEYTRKRTLDLKDYRFSISHLIKYGIYDFQVIRTFEFCNYYKKGKKKKSWYWEICRNFYDKSGKQVNVSRLLSNYGNFQSDLVLRDNTTTGYYRQTYNIDADLHYPETELRSEYVRKGIDHKLLSGTSLEILIKDFNCSEVETVVKAGYIELYQKWRADYVVRFFSSLKICIRNKYKIKDVTLYLDLLKALDTLNLDLHNAHYVCPENLKAAHDFYIDKIKKLEEAREAQRAIEQAEKLKREKTFNAKLFKKQKQKFFDLLFQVNNIEITPLKSIREFKTEGDELNHCIYRSKYYLEEDSLILSAKVEGKRTETIEVNLENFKIVQCRGYNNDPSPFHDDIMKLIKSKIPLIRKRIIHGKKTA